MAGSRSFTRLVWTHDEISPNLRDLPEKIDRGLAAIMQYQSNPVQNFARSNAPWTDRTSNARNGLAAEAYERGSTGPGRDAAGRFTRGGKAHGIVLYGQVPYQIWLEVRWSGRYAIIMPTIEEKGPDVMRMVNKLLERVA